MKVLVADGDALARARFVDACATRGHDVIEAEAGEPIPPLVGADAPAFIIALGAAAAARVRVEVGGASICVLGVGEDAAALLDAGADDVTSSTAKASELAARLTVVERRAVDEDRLVTEALRVLPDLIVRFGNEGRLLSVLPGLGYVPKLLRPSRIGETLEQVFAAQDASLLRAALDEVVRTQLPLVLEAELHLPGALRWFEMRWLPGRSNDVVVIARDISERKSADAKLKESQARTKALFESKMMGMLEWNVDGSINDANDALLAMVGYTRDDLEHGRVSWSRMTPEEYWPLEARAGEEIANTGVCTPFEKEYVRKDGSRVPIFIGGVALDELRSRGLSFVIDISDRKRVETQLRESNERFEVVARATSDAVWDWDIGTGRIVWNQTFLTLFGYGAQEVGAGVDWWSSKLHPEDAARVENSLDAAINGDAVTWSAEYRFRAANGRYAHVADRGSIIRGPDGRARRAIGAMVDVTERIEMQHRLLLADRLSSLGTLAAGVAHEINNPLTHVIGNLDVAVRRLREGGDPAKTTDALADARLGADRVRAIVRDLRTFARVDTAKRDIVDVRAPLEWATKIAGHAILQRARLESSLDAVPFVRGDESRLAQVFVNLLVNAAQAIPEGNVAGNRVRVSTEKRGDRVVVSVDDTGSGIPAEILGSIFDPFYTTKDVGVGTGLGLSICHGIVSSLGGTIEVDSEVGRGTIFRVVLPAAEGVAPVADVPKPAREGSGRRGRVLIVDDDALTRTLLERTLSNEHDVVAVAGADQALSMLLGGERFDVVFSDLMMPEMTGMDFHAELVRQVPDQAERIVFLTAGAMNPSVQRFLDDVPNPCVEKPFDGDALLELTRQRVAS